MHTAAARSLVDIAGAASSARIPPFLLRGQPPGRRRSVKAGAARATAKRLGLEGAALTWPTPRRQAKEGLASIGILCASHALAQGASGCLPTVTARLFRLWLPAHTAVTIVIGRHPRRVV